MITKAEVLDALENYWRDPVRDYPADHPALAALLANAEAADATRDRALRVALLPSPSELLDLVVAEIHATVCDSDNRSCVDADRLAAAGRAVTDILVRAAEGYPEPIGEALWRALHDGWDGEESADYLAARWIDHMASTHGADCPGRYCAATGARSAAEGAIYEHLADLATIPIEHQQYRPPGYYEGYRTALLDLLVHLGLDEEGPRV